MKLMMIKTMMMISTMIFALNMPMSMGMLLLIQTILVTLTLSKILTSSWMAMVTFLMFIGGLLILFMYMSSIASNEKFSPKLIMILPIILLFLPLEEMMTENLMIDNMDMFTQKETIILTKIYNKKTLMITIMLFMYMFLSMVMITSIIKIYKGPLRSSKY